MLLPTFFLSCSLIRAEILFAQVWFRHGSRTPSTFLTFPNEAIDFDALLPVEKGELTNEGKRQEYELGLRLRSELSGLLSKKYIAHENMFYFDEDNRTSESAALVAAGMYPVADDQIWNAELPWNPVALHEENILSRVGLAVTSYCPNIYDKVTKKKEYWDIMDMDRPLLELLKEKSGVDISTPKIYSDVLDSYWSRYELNDSRLPMPDWFNSTILQGTRDLQDAVTKRFFDIAEIYDSILVWHTTRIISEIELMLAQAADKRRKLVLFSAHDTNILALGRRLGFMDGGHLSEYGGSVTIEVHNVSSTLRLKFFFSSAFDAPRSEVFPPRCGAGCTFAQFRASYGSPRVDNDEFIALCTGVQQADHSTWISTLAALLVILVVSNVVTCMKLRRSLRAYVQMDDESTPLMERGDTVNK